eukprot:3031189-Prymnesium_polylepis.1
MRPEPWPRAQQAPQLVPQPASIAHRHPLVVRQHTLEPSQARVAAAGMRQERRFRSCTARKPRRSRGLRRWRLPSQLGQLVACALSNALLPLRLLEVGGAPHSHLSRAADPKATVKGSNRSPYSSAQPLAQSAKQQRLDNWVEVELLKIAAIAVALRGPVVSTVAVRVVAVRVVAVRVVAVRVDVVAQKRLERRQSARLKNRFDA